MRSAMGFFSLFRIPPCYLSLATSLLSFHLITRLENLLEPNDTRRHLNKAGAAGNESRHFGLFINSLCVLSGFAFVREASKLVPLVVSGQVVMLVRKSWNDLKRKAERMFHCAAEKKESDDFRQ